MRTKALVGLAVLAAGAATCVAQNNVYSLNIVGYVNKPVVANQFYMIENPLTKVNSGGNAITNVLQLSDDFDSSVLYAYQGGKVVAVETFVGGVGWLPGTTDMTPGKGFYFSPSFAGTVTFVGEVTLGATNTLATGYNLVGSPYPASMSLDALGLKGQDSDIVYRYVPATGGAKAKFNLITFVDGVGWIDDAVAGGGPVVGPNLNVGEAIYYLNNNPAQTWQQSFTVGP